jgi:hypothetical protein
MLTGDSKFATGANGTTATATAAVTVNAAPVKPTITLTATPTTVTAGKFSTQFSRLGIRTRDWELRNHNSRHRDDDFC